MDHIQQPIAFAAPIQPPYPAQHSTARPRSPFMPSSSRTAGSRSVSRSTANDHNPNAPMAAAATAPAPDLHVFVEAALSPELFSPILAAASLAPTPATLAPAAASVPTSKKLSGNPSLIALSYPTSSVAPFDPISAVQLSTITGCVDQYESVIVTIKGKHRKNVSSPAPTARAHGNSRYSKGEQWYERGQLPLGRKPSGSPFPPVAELQRMESTVEHRPRSVQKNKNRAANSKRSGPLVSMTLVTITQSAITTLPTMKPRLLVQAKSP